MTTEPVVDGELPITSQPWTLLHFRGYICVVNEEWGCWLYKDGKWMRCYPLSNDPLVYDEQWFYNA